MARVFWDSNLFIYLFEEHPVYEPQVSALRERMLNRGDELLTSWLAMGEVLTKPKERGDLRTTRRYRGLFTGPHITSLAFDDAAAECYSDIRSRRPKLGPADALNLACAAAAEVDLFVTNDSRLQRMEIRGIGRIAGLDPLPI